MKNATREFFSLHVLLDRKYAQENKAVTVLEQMSPNMKQLEHDYFSSLPAEDLKLLPNPSACPRSFFSVWGNWKQISDSSPTGRSQSLVCGQAKSPAGAWTDLVLLQLLG